MKNRLRRLAVLGIVTLSTLFSAQVIFAEDVEPAAAVESTETEAPVTETEAPVTETDPPVTETEAPVTETEAPVTETEAPVTETEGQEPETEIPATETETDESETGDVTTEPETEQPAQTTDSESETEKSTESEKTKEQKESEAAKRYEEKTGETLIAFTSYPAGNITANTNEIYDYLVQELGLNHAAACGVLANIQCESNFSTTAVGDGGTSYGLCQWHLGRFTQLISWCEANGFDYHLVPGQMGYLRYELETGYMGVYDYIRNVPDTAEGAYDAAYYWCKYFEIPSNLEANAKMRGNLAKNEFYPKTLGTQREEAAEVQPLSETIRVMEESPEQLLQMSRLGFSPELMLNRMQ